MDSQACDIASKVLEEQPSFIHSQLYNIGVGMANAKILTSRSHSHLYNIGVGMATLNNSVGGFASHGRMCNCISWKNVQLQTA
eukprot:13624115-Alexandrium_andersonii.AAC.1